LALKLGLKVGLLGLRVGDGDGKYVGLKLTVGWAVGATRNFVG
jgi:hypothetical protein